MATHTGNGGVVKVGSSPSTVAEVRDFSLSLSADTIETSVMGSTGRTYSPGMTSGSGSITCYWDETDTNGQEALTIGVDIAAELYPEGTASGAKYYDFQAIVTDVTVSTSFDGMVERTFSFTVDGNVTLSTVA